jgi:hypothetical protein
MRSAPPDAEHHFVVDGDDVFNDGLDIGKPAEPGSDIAFGASDAYYDSVGGKLRAKDSASAISTSPLHSLVNQRRIMATCSSLDILLDGLAPTITARRPQLTVDSAIASRQDSYPCVFPIETAELVRQVTRASSTERSSPVLLLLLLLLVGRSILVHKSECRLGNFLPAMVHGQRVSTTGHL